MWKMGVVGFGTDGAIVMKRKVLLVTQIINLTGEADLQVTVFQI